MIIQEVADMKIAVCIKQVPDTDDVKIDRKTGTLKRSEVSGILNPEDMSAVRMRESCCVTGHLPEGIPLLPLWYWRRR